MQQDQLFLETVNDLRAALAQPTAYRLIKASGLLRLLLLDGNNLLDRMETRLAMKASFYADDPFSRTAAWNTAPVGSYVYAMVDDIDPLVQLPPGFKRQPREFSRAEFFRIRLAAVDGTFYTVKDAIRLAALKLGGVHIDCLNTDGNSAAESAVTFELGSASLPVRQLSPIIGVVVRAMEPIERTLRAE